MKLGVIDNEGITKDELKELMKHLFKFSTLARTYSIIGTLINDLAIIQAIQSKICFHHLLIAGESGSGKTTIMTKIIVPILNYPIGEIKSIGMTTPFALTKELDNGNYVLLLDEYKPSRLDKNKNTKLSETFRNSYDRAVVTRGDKTLSVNYYHLIRPLIIAGEEGYYNQEKALIDRSCIVYFSKNERSKEHTEAMRYLEKNELLLNKLGRSLVDIILNLSVEEYAAIREGVSKYTEGLKDRPLNTALNICTGIEILNKVLINLELLTIKNYVDEVINNIKVEVLEGGEEPHSTVEKMLILYNQMIADDRAYGSENTVRFRGDGIFIRTSEMLTQIRTHVITTGLNTDILDDKDFIIQAKKAGYLIGKSNKKIKLTEGTVSKSKWFDTYSAEKLRFLHLDEVIPPILTEITEYGKAIPFA
ncbi:MAG: primase [Clostridiaceae bacterium]|nr:primase [Clostridiaceae bacterium]